MRAVIPRYSEGSRDDERFKFSFANSVLTPAEIGRMFEAEMAVILAAHAERPVDQWIDLPVAEDPDRLAVMTLLSNCLPAAYQIEPPLGVLMCAQMTLLSLQHGNCPASAHGYAAFGTGLHLTELGHSLLEPLHAVRAWGRRHIGEVERARLEYDAR